ncbi:hypothetical protein [Metabacillus fastidiosus]|uniref:hypothetical protein n=1 Tax=Metabacillus fastidiosus TaxID=1458 RepID=UPI003D2E6F5E
METHILITLLCTIASFFIGFLAFNRSRDKDVKSDASRNAVIETKLDNINSSVNSIMVDFRASEQRWNSVSDRVARTEESLKSLHKRVDFMENKEVNQS